MFPRSSNSIHLPHLRQSCPLFQNSKLSTKAVPILVRHKFYYNHIETTTQTRRILTQKTAVVLLTSGQGWLKTCATIIDFVLKKTKSIAKQASEVILTAELTIMQLKLTAWSPDPKGRESLPYRAGMGRASSYTLINNYSPKARRSRGDYSTILTEPEGNNCFSIFTRSDLNRIRKKNIKKRLVWLTGEVMREHEAVNSGCAKVRSLQYVQKWQMIVLIFLYPVL